VIRHYKGALLLLLVMMMMIQNKFVVRVFLMDNVCSCREDRRQDDWIDCGNMLDVTRPVSVAARMDIPHVSTSQLRDSTIKRGHTISGVTAEAGAAFERLLRRSYSDSSSSNGRRGHRVVSRRPLTVIAETNDVGHHADESTDNWTADNTLDSIDMRLSSYNTLDEVDARPVRSSVQSGDDYLQFSRDSVDVFESRGSVGTTLSTDGLDHVRFGSTRSERYFQQSSRDSGDVLASSGISGRHTTEAQSLASASVELTDDVSDADDDRKRKKSTKKKKKSVFQRVRERLRATFSRDADHRSSHRADKYLNPDVKASRQNWLTASFRRRRNKQRADHVTENGSTSASSHVKSSAANHQSHSTLDQQSVDHDQNKSKGLLSSLHRRFSSIRVKRSQSHGSGMSF